MRYIHSFIERKSLVHNIGVFFSATRRVSMDLESNPNLSFAARLLFGTLDTVVSHILFMQDYTTFETIEVVSRFPLLLTLFYSSIS